MLKSIIAALLGALIGLHPIPQGKHLMPAYLDHPCAYEDSTNCYWDAGAEGNHRGHSFFAVKIGNQTCLIYAATADRHWNHCMKGD